MPAPYDRATLLAAIAAAFYTNISQDIDGDTLAARLADIVESTFNLAEETPLNAGNALLNLQTFVSNGTYTPTTNARKAIVICTAAGAGRVNAAAGSAGGTAIDFLDLTGISSIAVTVGTSASGGAGGSSSVGTYASATGGSNGSEAAGGIGTLGDILLRGGAAGSAAGGALATGGASFWGGAGAYGSGANGTTTGSAAGGNGVVVILEFG